MANILRIRDENGNFVGIPAIRGEPGQKGDKGDKGDRGEQGMQGIQGLKGETGAQGAKGADGTPATHRWSGTTLYITSASGTSSANLKGDKGDTGSAGAKGEDGYTPQKGIDYFTEAEKQEIVDEVAEIVGTGGGGQSADKKWTLLNEITLTEEVGNINITTDSSGNVFEVEEILIIGVISSNQASRKSCYFNVGDGDIICNSIVKNSGYFGPCYFMVENVGGMRRVSYSASDNCSTKPGFDNLPNPVGQMQTTYHAVGAIKPYVDKITSITIKHINWGSQFFAAGSVFRVYTR